MLTLWSPEKNHAHNLMARLYWQQIVGSSTVRVADVKHGPPRHRTLLVRRPSGPRRHSCDIIQSEALFDDMFAPGTNQLDEVVFFVCAREECHNTSSPPNMRTRRRNYELQLYN